MRSTHDTIARYDTDYSPMQSNNSPSSSHHEDDDGAGAGSEGQDNPNTPTYSTSSKPAGAVRKDRACPFCKQTFTSSSLGRHLDFFIRPNRPKLPDGVHDVDQIRKIRGTITRRHARTSAAHKKEQQDRTSTAPSTPKTEFKTMEPKTDGDEDRERPADLQNQQAQAQADIQPHPSTVQPAAPPPNQEAPQQVRNWTVTGVINNLPPRENSIRYPRILPQPVQQQQQYRHLGIDQEEADTAHAAELALREVLDTLRRASARIANAPLFDFDFFSLNFPALCLRLLPPPTTLYSASPMPSATSLPLSGTPARSHLESIYEVLNDRIRRQEAYPSSEHRPPEPLRYYNHLDDAFHHWEGQSHSQQQAIWQLELVRAYDTERSARTTADCRLDELHTELASLTSQLEAVRSQLPAWVQAVPLLGPDQQRPTPISPLHLSSHKFKDLRHVGLDVRDWDYEQLIAKWKSTAQSERSRRQWLGLPRPVASLSGGASPALDSLDSHTMPPLRPLSARMPAPPKEEYGHTQRQAGTSMYIPPETTSARSAGIDGQILPVTNGQIGGTDWNDRPAECGDEDQKPGQEDVDMQEQGEYSITARPETRTAHQDFLRAASRSGVIMNGHASRSYG